MSKSLVPTQNKKENHSFGEHYKFQRKHSSLLSVDQDRILLFNNDNEDESEANDFQMANIDNSSNLLSPTKSTHDYHPINTNKNFFSITQMLFMYAEKDLNTLTNSNDNLNNILNVLELYFNTYADNKRQIYFEGIFQILYDFKEQINELILIETMEFLQINPLDSCTFENFIRILCYLPSINRNDNIFLNIFKEFDQNNDGYITYDDIQSILPHLISNFDQEIIHAAIHTLDIDHDDNRLSYFDFVTSFIALNECQFNMKIKTENYSYFYLVSNRIYLKILDL